MKTVNKAVQSDRNLQQTRKETVHRELARKREAMAFVTEILVLLTAGPQTRRMF